MTHFYSNSPYNEIPDELLSEFTMNGTIPVLHWWFDGSKQQKVVWSLACVDAHLQQFSIDNIESGNCSGESYPGVAALLLLAFQKNNIVGKNVAVVGSETPWIEAMLLNLRNRVTTVEYNVPSVHDNRIKCMSYTDFTLTSNEYDCVVSFSSIEHSGLGRYGDPLEPNGDIETMQVIHKNLKENGVLIWGAPVGHDAFVWNAHRIYGKIRLPLLFQKFDEIEWFGFKKEDLLNMPLQPYVWQPVVSLTKKNN